jgi:tRNA/rRNA methyltransferase
MPDRINLKNVAIVLHKTRYPENIGAAARAILNMGIQDLIVVAPRNYEKSKALKLATHAAASLIENLKIYDNLQDALAPFQYIVGTTARLGGERQVVNTPGIMAERLVPISQTNRVALLFGPEDAGLSNVDIRACHALVNIPTAEFSSINLAQAVMILCYELFLASRTGKKIFVPRLASRHELDGMYAQLKEILVRISFINPENPDYWMNNLRRFFNRYGLRARDVSIVRGICRQIDWYGGKCYQDGLKENSKKPQGDNE